MYNHSKNLLPHISRSQIQFYQCTLLFDESWLQVPPNQQFTVIQNHPGTIIQNSTINSLCSNTIPSKYKVLFMFQSRPVRNHIEDKAHQTPSNYFLQTRYHLFPSALCCTSSFHSLTEVLKLLCLLIRQVKELTSLWQS